MKSVRWWAGGSADSRALGQKLLYIRHDPLRISSLLIKRWGHAPVETMAVVLRVKATLSVPCVGVRKNQWRWTNDGVTSETSMNSLKLLDPLLHLFSHCLIRAHERLLVDHDFGRVGFRPTDSGGDRGGVGLDNNAIVYGLV